ncbi:MAG: hypothetical protein K2H91_02375, partial [Lachnospiraceae bacterium]|nr:hypothetical protein [Lachnospiraceae bacterium]
MLARKKEDFFRILHLIQEKDPENFYKAHFAHFRVVLQMFYYLFDQLLLQKLKIVKTENSMGFKSLSELYSLPHIYQICSGLLS